MVQTVKENLKKLTDGDWEVKLARLLLVQHITPHTTTGLSPAEVLMKRRLRTALDFLQPDLIRDMTEKQEKNPDGRKLRSFSEEDSVFARNYSKGPLWIPAHIEEKTGPLSYTVRTSQGEMFRRHSDQLRNRVEDNMIPVVPTSELPEMEREPATDEYPPTSLSVRNTEVTPSPSTARPVRMKKKPLYLSDYEV